VKLASLGYGVVCADSDGPAARTTASSLPLATYAEIDVTSEADTERAVLRAHSEFGSLRVAVACAGIHRQGTVTEMSRQLFDRVMAVNATGSFVTARVAARAMIETGGGGSISLIGSMNSVAVSMAGQAAYAASKGAVLMLGKTLAVDWASLGIRVNVVLPGVTDTPLSRPSLTDPSSRSSVLSKVPLGCPARPEDIADVIGFLASPAAAYLTGAAIPVDGGQLALTSSYPWVH
jgi:NAD(P)-dependent dehydrogenase (short-subunit alcohol dehydrogenase family)